VGELFGVRECWLANVHERCYAILSLDRHGVVKRTLCAGGDIAPSDVLPDLKLPAFLSW